MVKKPLEYECWDLPIKQSPVASRLYSLRPEGIGTPFVESLTSYITRLAEAHSVTTGTLVMREVLPKVRRTRGAFAGQPPPTARQPWIFLGTHILNGLGECPPEWVKVIENLTGCSALHLLTVLPWTGLLDNVGLLRTSLAWCAACLEDQRTSGSVIHERLLWTLKAVSVCPWHRRPLDQLCHHCGRWLYPFSGNSRPGYCSRCQKWLGQRFNADDACEDEPELAEQIWTAEAIAAMVAANVRSPHSDSLRINLRTCAERCAHRSRRALRLSTGCDIREWVTGGKSPRMESLLRLCRALKLSPARLFTEAIPFADQMWDFGEERIRRESPNPQRHAPPTAKTIAEALERALNSDLPLSVEKVAEQFGYRSDSCLRQLQPDLCARLTQKRRAPSAKRTAADQVRRALEAGIAQNPPPSLQGVATSLGLRGCSRLYRRFPKLCRALSARNRGFKWLPKKPMENILRKALTESPPPALDVVARRGGFRQTRSLWMRFPDLMQALKTRGIQTRSSTNTKSVCTKPSLRVPPQAEAIFQAALLEERAPSLRSVVTRIPNHHNTALRRAFPELWRSIRARYQLRKKLALSERHRLLSQTVLEIVTDLSSRGIRPTQTLVQLTVRQRSRDSLRSLYVIGHAIREALSAHST
jgi:TniQ protein